MSETANDKPADVDGSAASLCYPHLFFVGDRVLITCDHEGYNGKTGFIAAVFPSGRCQVKIGKIALLNLRPEGMKHEVSD